MKKIIIAFLCLLSFSFAAEAYNSYAPNSWDTVKQEAWDYKAIYGFCERGKAPGYDKSFFDRGSLTRYELASVLKSVLENQTEGNASASLTADEMNMLSRLKKEYGRELEALGWKEPQKHKDPILEIGGDARVRWTKGENTDARVRVGGRWDIGSDTYVEGQGSTSREL